MKRFVWVFCFVLIASLSAQSKASAREALSNFAWPDSVQKLLLDNWQRGGEVLVLPQARIMMSGWSIVDRSQYAYQLLPAGTIVHVWRVSIADSDWFLLWQPEQQIWHSYAQAVFVEPEPSFIVAVEIYDFSINGSYLQTTFIQPDAYGQTWLQLDREWIVGREMLRFKLGGAIGMRLLTGSISQQWSPQQRLSMQTNWYGSANTWHWYSNSSIVNDGRRGQMSQYVETYQQLSYRPFSLKHWLARVDYFGSQDIGKQWLYAQGSAGIYWVWPIVYSHPQLSFGWIYQSANMSNIWQERQQWRPRSGDVVVHYDSQYWWLQLQYGLYQHVLGQSGIIVSKNNQPRFSLSAGVHLLWKDRK
ncbi:MAG: hypothetical protein ACKKL5_00955 [Candidatus Komeilibacteria bacterium]